MCISVHVERGNMRVGREDEEGERERERRQKRVAAEKALGAVREKKTRGLHNGQARKELKETTDCGEQQTITQPNNNMRAPTNLCLAREKKCKRRKMSIMERGKRAEEREMKRETGARVV